MQLLKYYILLDGQNIQVNKNLKVLVRPKINYQMPYLLKNIISKKSFIFFLNYLNLIQIFCFLPENYNFLIYQSQPKAFFDYL